MPYYLFYWLIITFLFVIFKGVLLPFLIWRLLYISELSVTIYEISSMIIGGFTLFFLISTGYLGKKYFQLKSVNYWIVNGGIGFMLLLFHFFKSDFYIFPFFYWFLEEWIDLLAEPLRILFNGAGWPQYVAILSFLAFSYMGRKIELLDEEESKSFQGSERRIFYDRN